MGAFQRSITVLFAIGLKECLRLEVDASRIPIQYPVNSTQDTAESSQVLVRGYHTLRHAFPGDFRLLRSDPYGSL
jgi:hypothetical protein